MIEHAHWLCDFVAEAQAILHDHKECGRYSPAEVVDRLNALFKEAGLDRAMYGVGYFPADIPPPSILGSS